MKKINNSDEMRKLLFMLIGTATLVIGVALFFFIARQQGEINWQNISMMLLPFLIVLFMIFFLIRRFKEVKKGLPLEDERSKKVMHMAAAKAFYFTLYWLLAISIFEQLFSEKIFGAAQLDAGQTSGLGILGMSIAFFIFWIYYDRKGTTI